MSGKHILLKGAFVLTLTGFATRFMGFFYRIFLSRAFGEEGVGLYQLVFPVYALCFSLTCAGIETAISRCVAKKTATGQPKEALGLLYTGLFLTLTASCCATLFLQNFAGWIADVFLQEPRCSHLLVILSYAFPFAAAHSCIVGYYLGQKATRIPASSQLVEQTVRILSVYLLYWIGAKNGASFGISVAVAGLAAGELASSAFCLRAVLREVPRKSRSRLRFFSFFKYARELLTFSLPLTANRVLLNILQSAEAISIPLRLQIYGMSSKEALSAYGVLTGMALPCVLFPSAITNSLSTMLLPTVAEIQAADNRKALSGIIQKSVYSCVFMGSVCCVALLCFGQWQFSCRRFYRDSGLDLSLSLRRQYTHQYSEWAGKDRPFLPDQRRQPDCPHRKCFLSDPCLWDPGISVGASGKSGLCICLLRRISVHLDPFRNSSLVHSSDSRPASKQLCLLLKSS